MAHHPSVVSFGLLAFLSACARGGPERSDGGAPGLAAARTPSHELGEVVTQMSDSLWVLHQDRRKRHWFGSDGQGVYCFDGKQLVRYSTRDGLAHDQIRDIQEDDSGNLYINTNGGIVKFDGQGFTTLVPVESDAWKLEPGDLWFTGSPYRFDGETLHRLKFPPYAVGDLFHSKFPGVPYSPYDVYTIYKDRRGALWFGTAALGACRFDGASFAWVADDELTELDDGPSWGVRGIVEDKDGKFWFSNLLHGYEVDPDRAAAQASSSWYRKEGGLVGRDGRFKRGPGYFMSCLEDRHGVVWIATYGEGVWRYDGEQLTHVPVLEDGRPIHLFSIREDRDGVLWLGTQENGAWRHDGTGFVRFRP